MSRPPLGGQVAIVTGGGRGIGRAIAERLHADGATVVIADRDAVTGPATAAAIDGRFIEADCSRRTDMAIVVGRTLAELGRLDIFIANAGIGPTMSLLETPDELWDRVLDINLRGAFIGIQLAARAMADRGGGRICVTASTNAFWMETDLAAYNASKAGLLALARTAAMELAPRGITVNAVGPGLIATDLTRGLTEDPDASRIYLRQIPLGRFGTPADVAAAVAFLVSADAAWITGHLLVVDGGQTLGTPWPGE